MTKLAPHHYRRWRLLSVAVLSLVFGAAQGISRQNGQGSEWRRYSFDHSNTNHNPREWRISPKTASNLVRAWLTFNDDALVNSPPPTGFVLEEALGLHYRRSVVGVISLPVIRDGII